MGVNSLSRQIYQEIEMLQSLSEGVGHKAKERVRCVLQRLKQLEDLISQDRFYCWDDLAQAYHSRTDLLATAYDLLYGNAN